MTCFKNSICGSIEIAAVLIGELSSDKSWLN